MRTTGIALAAAACVVGIVPVAAGSGLLSAFAARGGSTALGVHGADSVRRPPVAVGGSTPGAAAAPIGVSNDGLPPARLEDGNLLANPGFEPPYAPQGAVELILADGWLPWYDDAGPRPEFKDELHARTRPDGSIAGFSFRVFHGETVQKFFTSSRSHDAGFYQRVAVEDGATLSAEIWAHTWSSDCDDPCVSPREPCPGSSNSHGTYFVQVGLDPYGGVPDSLGDPPPASVMWSEPLVFEAYDDWTRLSVTATARADAVTLYTRGHPLWPVKHNDSYWDDARLEVLAPPPTGSPTAGPPATATTTLEPAPSGTVPVGTPATSTAVATPDLRPGAFLPRAETHHRAGPAAGRTPPQAIAPSPPQASAPSPGPTEDRESRTKRGPGVSCDTAPSGAPCATVPASADIRIEYPIRTHPSQKNFGLPATCSELAFESLLVRNHGAVEVYMDGWRLTAGSGASYAFPGLRLPPGGQVRVWTRPGADTFTSEAFVDVYWGRLEPAWDNVSDEAVVLDEEGTEVARRGYP